MPCLVSFHPSSSHAFWRWKASKDGGVREEMQALPSLTKQGWNHSVGLMSWVTDLFFPSLLVFSGSTWHKHCTGWTGLASRPSRSRGEYTHSRKGSHWQYWMMEKYNPCWNCTLPLEAELLEAPPPLDILCFISLSPFTCADSPLASFLRTDAYWLPVWLNISLKYTVSMK